MSVSSSAVGQAPIILATQETNMEKMASLTPAVQHSVFKISLGSLDGPCLNIKSDNWSQAVVARAFHPSTVETGGQPELLSEFLSWKTKKSKTKIVLKAWG